MLVYTHFLRSLKSSEHLEQLRLSSASLTTDYFVNTYIIINGQGNHLMFAVCLSLPSCPRRPSSFFFLLFSLTSVRLVQIECDIHRRVSSLYSTRQCTHSIQMFDWHQTLRKRKEREGERKREIVLVVAFCICTEGHEHTYIHRHMYVDRENK